MVHTAAGNAAWCPAMLARGDTLDDLWRFCVLQTLDDYTSTLRWGGAQEAARVFAEVGTAIDDDVVHSIHIYSFR